MTYDKRHKEVLPAIVGQYGLAKSLDGTHHGIGLITSVEESSIRMNVVEKCANGEYVRDDIAISKDEWGAMQHQNRLQIARGKKVVKKYAMWLLMSNQIKKD